MPSWLWWFDETKGLLLIAICILALIIIDFIAIVIKYKNKI